MLGCARLQAPAGAPAGADAGWRVVAVLGDAAGVLEGGVTATTFSADGRLAAFGGAAGAEVIEIPSRRRVRFIREARVNGHALALSPDGRLLAASGRGKQVRLWDVASGADRSTVDVGRAPTAIAFSPRGDLLAIGGEDLAIELWDLGKRRWSWRKVATSAGGQVRALAFSGDGQLLLSGSNVDISGGGGNEADIWLESPRLWDVAGGAQVAALDEGQSLTAASADGRRIVGAGGTAVRVWDRASGREIATLQHFPERVSGQSVTGVGLTPDGGRAISLGGDGTLVVWDVAAERELSRIAAHAGNAMALAVSPDGRHALTGARDGRARLWDLTTMTEVGGASAHTSAIGALAIDGDAGQPARPRLRSAAQDGRILSWRWPGPLGQTSAGVPAPEPEASWNPPPALQGWDPPVRAMTFARAGDILLVCDRERVKAVRAGSGDTLWQYALPNGGHISSLAAGPGARARMVAVAGGVGALLDLDTGKPRLALPPRPPLSLVVLSSDERWLAAGDSDGGLWIADADTGTPRVRLAGHAGALVDLDGKLVKTDRSPAVTGVFSADGTLLATAGDDRAVRVWDRATGAALGAVGLAQGIHVPLLAFSPDGRRLVIADEAGRLLVTDARRPGQVAAIDLARTAGLEGARPRALAFSPTEPILFVGTGRGPIAILRF